MMQLLTVYMCSIILVKFNSEEEEEKKKAGIEIEELEPSGSSDKAALTSPSSATLTQQPFQLFTALQTRNKSLTALF